LYRGNRARASIASLVVELGRSPSPGGVRDALAQMLGDPELQLAYRRTDAETYVDAHGRPLDLAAGPGRATTPLLGEGHPIAALMHDARLLDDPGFIEEVVAAARLAIENERFQAEVRAQLESLRASRARIVEAGDTERCRLERDLHDGAQQRLVGVSLALRLARAQIGANPDPNAVAQLDEADAELRQALGELRELAHGIYPAVLADEGLGAALETLAEQSPLSIKLDAVPEERFAPAVEAVAYFLVVETLKRSRASHVTVGAQRRDGRLWIELRGDGELAADLIDLEDRLGALDGQMVVDRAPEQMRLWAHLPCA
jgi:signal transduction histidine kinase